jgi:hypothetical protein
MIEKLTEDQYEEWDRLALTAKGGTLFHQSWYLRALVEDLEFYVLRDKDGQIQAGMVWSLRSFLGTRAIRRPAWTPYNGPLVRASQKDTPLARASQEKTLMVELLAHSPRLGLYDYMFAPAWTDMIPFIWNGFETSVSYTYRIPPAPPEQWMATMNPGHRRDLRKAHEVLQGNGAAIEEDPPFDDCFPLIGDTSRSKEFPIRAPQQTLGRWWQVLVDRNAAKSYLIREKSGQPVCAVLLAMDNHCAYYLASGIRADARRGPLNLLSRVLIERMILHAHGRGLIFDFEGSVLPAVETFFRNWGGLCVPYYRAVKIPRSWTFAAWSLHRYWTRHRRGAAPLKSSKRGPLDA